MGYMNKLFTILVVAIVAAVPAVATAQKPPKPTKPNNNLTIKASATKVTFGKSVTFTGTTRNMPAGTAVEVWENPYPYSAGFKNTGRAGVVDPSGNYTVTGVKPTMHTQYKVVARSSPPTESATVFVQVALRVSFRVSDSTPKRGARVRFYGSVAPAPHVGKLVSIQRRSSTGKFVTVARTRTSATSTYSRRVRVRSTGVYRVLVQSADQDHLDGTSRTRTLRAHR